ncbi:MAG: response regulator transcription factor [Clostridia bacterium]|nr:response regulator transcription factor [Clostridia bacterium]
MKVLIIEDDKILSDTIKQCIEDKYSVTQAIDGYEGYIFAKEDIFDIIVLDLMMPEMNGFDVLSKLRNEGVLTPVLILTAKDSLNDKVKGLNLGADDYLVKPFERAELIARLDAIVRRNNGFFVNDVLTFKDLKLNLKNRKVFVKDKEVVLQGKQFDLLEYLINSKDTIITKEQIFDKIWGFDSDTSTNVVEVYASGLRKVLKKCGYDKYIKTLRGVGYIFSSEE